MSIRYYTKVCSKHQLVLANGAHELNQKIRLELYLQVGIKNKSINSIAYIFFVWVVWLISILLS
jgi:hypothetical protein